MSQFFVYTSAGNLPPSVLENFTFDDGTTSVPTSHNINIHSGAGILVTALPNATGGPDYTISAVGEGFKWQDVNSNFNASVSNGYFCYAPLTATLPITANTPNGSAISFFAVVANIVVTASPLQAIIIGNDISGASQTATTITAGSCLTLVFRSTNLTWNATSAVGSWNLS